MTKEDTVFGSEALKNRPKINQSLDLQKLRIDVKEGFLLSRVDGKTSVEQLLMVSGMSRQETMHSLSRLLREGIIFFEGEPKVAAKLAPGVPVKDEEIQGEEGEAEEEVEIAEEDKKKILSTYESLGEFNYYKILGIKKDADKREIKRAYFALSREFHPDRYFRKTIGTFKPMLEAIFRKVSEAYEVVYDPESRKEYDKSIMSEEQIAEARKESEMQARAGRPVGKALKPIMERLAKAKGFFKAGKKDFLDKNYKSASVHFKLAIAYDPYNEQYKKSFAEAQKIVKQGELERLMGRASFEEEVGRFTDALKLMEQAVQITSDNPEPYHKLARLLLTHGRDLRQAKNYCLRAIDISSKNPEYYLTLGSIYQAAGLFRNATREFEKVLRLDKGNSEAQEHLKELRRLR